MVEVALSPMVVSCTGSDDVRPTHMTIMNLEVWRSNKFICEICWTHLWWPP